MKHLHNTLTPLLALLLFITPIVRAEVAPKIEPYEAWFVMNMGGSKAGHMHITLKQDGKQIISTTAMKIAIKRGQAEMQIEQSSTFVESVDHKPIRAESSMALGAMATKTSLVFGEKQWKMTSESAGQKNTSDIEPPDAEWLTPGALAAVMEQAIERGDEQITVTTLDLSMGISPVTMKMKRGESADVEVFGRVVQARKWTTTMTAAPGIEIEQWTDAAGQPVRQVVPLMPGMEMEMLLADKALALTEFDAPEMLAASLITPDKPIKNPRKLKRAVFELSSEDLKQNLGDAVVNDGYQQMNWLDENTLRVTIDLQPKRGQALEKHMRFADIDQAKKSLGERAGDYLASTTMLNHQDEIVAQLVTQATVKESVKWGDGRYQAPQLAETFRQIVREHIDAKDLSVGFASASETARTKQGDCTEHACLLSAMLRGAGIPSRTVTGLVYADQFAGHEGVFGFHMWSQAWITTTDGKGYWLDLDAAAPGQVNGFDATHIALSTSALSDGDTFNDLVTMLPLMQGLEIKAVELEWAD